MNKNEFRIKFLTEKLEKLSGKKVSLKENYIGEESYARVDYTEEDVIKLLTIINENKEVQNLIKQIVGSPLPEDNY